jgi:hypothetical protein
LEIGVSAIASIPATRAKAAAVASGKAIFPTFPIFRAWTIWIVRGFI